MEAIMRSTQWALAASTVAAIVASENACAQSPTEQARTLQQEVLVNRLDQPHSETDFRLDSLRGKRARGRFYQASQGEREPYQVVRMSWA